MTDLENIIIQSHTIAVVGYSAKPERASHWIADYLEKHGYQVFRVNPVVKSTDEVPIYASLDDLPEGIDIVDIFRAPDHMPAIVAAAIAQGAKTVWMQPGAENESAAETARAAGLSAVVGACLYAEHKALHGIVHEHP